MMNNEIHNIQIEPFCPEEPSVTTTGELIESNGETYSDGHTWWNSQVSTTQKGREYSIQMGTLDRSVFKKVSDLLAQIMDEEYARRHY